MRRPAGAHLTLAAVAAGGAIGAWGRLGLAEALPADPGRWPWGTFAANLVACAILGYAGTLLLERLPPSAYRRPLVGTGLCGGLSTFSTLHVEVVDLGRDGHAPLAAAYLGTSVVAGVVVILLASGLARGARLAAR